MLEVRDAINASIAYIHEFSDYINPAEARLEETEFDESANEWLITLSLIENAFSGTRTYKIFRIDASTGKIKSMKNRSLFAK
jgi:hypothetical protein